MDVKTNKADAPERIPHVSHTQLSIAKHYGGITYNGASYTYIAEDDCLVRNDVFRRDEKAKQQWARSERERWTKARQSFTTPGHAPGF